MVISAGQESIKALAASAGFMVEMRHITKSFGKLVANNDVSLKIRKSEIHALLGENGAGKSTLMNVLYGLYGKDEGTILWEGQEVSIKDPDEAIKLGIGMIHQHFMKKSGRDAKDFLAHEQARPDIVELSAIARSLLLSDLSGCRVNITHLSSKRGLEMIKEAKAKGMQKLCLPTRRRLPGASSTDAQISSSSAS